VEDIKYGYVTGEGRFFFILSYIDVFTRQTIGYHIGKRCEAADVVSTLKSAMLKRRLYENGNTKLPTIRSDNGPQFISDMSTKYSTFSV